MREVHVETTRTARLCLLGPTHPASPTEVWYVLHGYRQLADRFLGRFRRIVANHRLFVAPEGLSRFYVSSGREGGAEERVGASWMTRHEREWEIRDYLAYLDRVVPVVEEGLEPDRRIVLGFSQGAHTAMRWATLGGVAIDQLILWGWSLPRDIPPSSADRLASIDLVLVRGAGDATRQPEEEARDESWLAENGVAYRVHEHAGGHSIDEATLEAVTLGTR